MPVAELGTFTFISFNKNNGCESRWRLRSSNSLPKVTWRERQDRDPCFRAAKPIYFLYSVSWFWTLLLMKGPKIYTFSPFLDCLSLSLENRPSEICAPGPDYLVGLLPLPLALKGTTSVKLNTVCTWACGWSLAYCIVLNPPWKTPGEISLRSPIPR